MQRHGWREGYGRRENKLKWLEFSKLGELAGVDCRCKQTWIIEKAVWILYCAHWEAIWRFLCEK